MQAIARALYSREKIVLFDDVLSGLDAVTRDLVVARVFGRDGLLRKMGATAIIATHFGKTGYRYFMLRYTLMF